MPLRFRSIRPARFSLGRFYEGVIPISLSGSHIVHLQGQVIAQAFAGDTDPVRQTSLKMEGIVDTSDDTANINIWADGVHYHLKTDSSAASDPAPIAARVVALIKARDWNALYPCLDDQIRGAYSQAQFVQSMTSQDDGGALVDLTVSGAGQVSTSQLGVTADAQAVAETTRNADGTTTTTTTMYLVYEEGAWHYASTDPIPSDPVTAKIEGSQP